MAPQLPRLRQSIVLNALFSVLSAIASSCYAGIWNALFLIGWNTTTRGDRTPNLRAHIERFISNLKHEGLDCFMAIGEWHLNETSRKRQLHDKRERQRSARESSAVRFCQFRAISNSHSAARCRLYYLDPTQKHAYRYCRMRVLPDVTQ